jgi:HSP20 family protein
MATVVRWNPFREMAAMQTALDRMFDQTWRTAWPTFNGASLAFDAFETDTAYTVMAALPGLTPDQINVRFQDGTLTISAEIPQPTFPENARVLLQERAFGQFSRSITLPQPVDADHVEATYENGILTLTLPKSPEAQPKLISVKSPNLLQSNN